MGILDMLIGGGISSAGNYFGQMQAENFNADQSQMNRDFQERMSSTAHQREVKDLMAAGLNPILSVNHGASTPGGSSASTSAMDYGSKAVSSGQQASDAVENAKSKEVERSLLTEQATKTRAEQQKVSADTEVSKKQLDVMDQEVKTHIQNREASAKGIERVNAELDIVRERIKEARVKGNDAEIKLQAQKESWLYQQLSILSAAGHKLGEAIGSVPGGAISNMFKGLKP